MSVDMKNLSPEVAEYIKTLENENQKLKQQNANLTELIIKKSKENVRKIK